MGVGWWWRSPLLRLGPKRVRTREVARKGGHGDANEEGAGRFWDGWDGRRGWRGSTGGRAGRSGERSELGTLVLSEGEIKVLGLQFREFHYAWGAVGGGGRGFQWSEYSEAGHGRRAGWLGWGECHWGSRTAGTDSRSGRAAVVPSGGQNSGGGVATEQWAFRESAADGAPAEEAVGWRGGSTRGFEAATLPG